MKTQNPHSAPGLYGWLKGVVQPGNAWYFPEPSVLPRGQGTEGLAGAPCQAELSRITGKGMSLWKK